MFGNCNVCSGYCDHLHKHHIISRSKGGTNKEYNIAYLCGNCHDLVHHGDITLECWRLTGVGKRLIWRKTTDPSITGVKDPEVFIYGESKPNQTL